MANITRKNGNLYLVDGTTETIINKKIDSHGKYYWVLPKNSANRQYFQVEKLEKFLSENNGTVELTESIKHQRTEGSQPSVPRKPLEDFLEGEERETFIKLKNKAMAKMNENTVLEKAKLALEKAQAEYARLLELAKNGGQ